MNSPIADGLSEERNGNPKNGDITKSWTPDYEQPTDLRYAPEPHHSHERAEVTPHSTDELMSELLDGQQVLISAQHEFLRDHDMTRLAAAQRRFIMVQMSVLNRLGIFG
jgi:hypothetical protein